jgi:hypothetical protein
MRSVRPALLLAILCSGCVHFASPQPPDAPPRLSNDEVAELLPGRVHDKQGWAEDLVAALDENKLPIDVTHVCGVVAVAEQESGFQANPAVPNLPAIARRALEEKARGLGPLGKPALEEILDVKAPGEKKTFDQRIDALRTEADLDHLFRDLLAEHRRRHPVLFAVGDMGAQLFDARTFAERNPVTTAGSMQVSVRYSERRARTLEHAPDKVRDALYTRPGGLLYGTARLWTFDAAYDLPLYRFADYNAGLYASRNAAFQEQLAALTDHKLTLDGDLLSYDALEEVKSEDTKTMAALVAFRDAYAPKLTDAQLRRDARLEKTERFERTETWSTLKRVYAERKHKAAAYARLPEVTLSSPKLQRDLSTAWFAKSVEKRYLACLTRAAP